MRRIGLKRAIEFIELNKSIQNENIEPEFRHSSLSYFSSIHEKLTDMLSDCFSKKEKIELTFTIEELHMSLASAELESIIQNSPTLKSLYERNLVSIEAMSRLGCPYMEINFKPGLSVSEVKIRFKPQCYVLSTTIEEYHFMLSDEVNHKREFITESGFTRKSINRFSKEVENYLLSIMDNTVNIKGLKEWMTI